MRFRSLQFQCAVAALTAVVLAGCGGSGSSHSTYTGGGTVTTSAGKFTQANLVADQTGVATVTDPNLVNPWGVSFSPTGAFWVSDNGTGLSTLYSGTGSIVPLVVKIPAAGGGSKGPVSGQVFNGTTSFSLTTGGPAAFIFDSEDGLITAWNSGTAAVTVADRSSTGAIYKGLAMATNGGAPFLYAANFWANSVDVFDGTFKFTTSFTDPSIPSGFAPFGITTIGNLLYVTYAKQDAAKHDDIPGLGNGYVDIFNPNGTLVKRLVNQGQLDSPWGVAQAPSGFGTLGGDILVGNFGNGWINAYDPTTGAYKGSLETPAGSPIAIDGLWALTFGNGGSGGSASTLYFTAGPDNETHGLMGSLVPSS